MGQPIDLIITDLPVYLYYPVNCMISMVRELLDHGHAQVGWAKWEEVRGVMSWQSGAH